MGKAVLGLFVSRRFVNLLADMFPYFTFKKIKGSHFLSECVENKSSRSRFMNK